jgi:hypothetical protein
MNSPPSSAPPPNRPSRAIAVPDDSELEDFQLIDNEFGCDLGNLLRSYHLGSYDAGGEG